VSAGRFFADVAQLVEHSLGKGEVISSILIIGSRDCERAAPKLESSSGAKSVEAVKAGVTQW
jgi:hypothetical protein